MADLRSGDVDQPWAELMARAKEGDEDAFAAIWRRHQPALLRYLEIVGGRDGAEDVAADTWVSVVRSLPGFRGDAAGFKAMLYTAARSRLVDRFRRAQVRPHVVADLETVGGLDGLDGRRAFGDVGDSIERDEATRAALSLIACLPPGQAEVVALRVIAGLDNAEVARLIGKRSGAVRVAYSRGVAALAAMVQPPSRVTDPDAPAFR